MSEGKELFTFVVEYKGGTFCSQFWAEDIRQAIECYNSHDPSGQGAVPLHDPVNLDGLTNAWYADEGMDSEKVILANIVKTVC